jgi:hypothetical protein
MAHLQTRGTSKPVAAPAPAAPEWPFFTFEDFANVSLSCQAGWMIDIRASYAMGVVKLRTPAWLVRIGWLVGEPESAVISTVMSPESGGAVTV